MFYRAVVLPFCKYSVGCVNTIGNSSRPNPPWLSFGFGPVENFMLGLYSRPRPSPSPRVLPFPSVQMQGHSDRIQIGLFPRDAHQQWATAIGLLRSTGTIDTWAGAASSLRPLLDGNSREIAEIEAAAAALTRIVKLTVCRRGARRLLSFARLEHSSNVGR